MTTKRPNSNGHVSSKRRQTIMPSSTNSVDSSGISECFHKITTEMYVSLAPIHLNDPVNGIKAQHLDPLVMQYFPKARGVVLSYSNIKLDNDNITTDTDGNPILIAKIEGSSPITFLWITLDLLVWRPQVGDSVEGYIYMQTASHLGLLIHDTFNASIKKYNIPADWQFIPSQEDEELATESEDTKFKSFGYWVDENENKVEGKLQFTIKSIHSAGRVVSLEGTLIKPGSERESQPVERRTSVQKIEYKHSEESKHTKFDDEREASEIPEPTSEEDIPAYTMGSDGEIEEEEDSD